MIDFTSKVITFFRADTSDMKAGLKELQGEEKKLAQTQLKAAEDRNKGYDQWIERLGNLNQALELGGKVIAVAQAGFKAYSDDLRMRAAAGTVSIDKLKAASLGLRTEQELLAFAAKASHGVFKLTEEQMATAQKAMVALTRAGFDQEEVTNKITEALVKGKAEGLDDFGMALRTGKTDVENFNILMEGLASKAAGVKDGTLTAAEGVESMGVTMHDSIDKMKQAIGQLVVAMGPLLNALASAVAIVAELAKGHTEVREQGGTQAFMENLVMRQRGFVRDESGKWVQADELRGRQALAGFSAAGDFSAMRSRQVFGQFAAAGDFNAMRSRQSQGADGVITALESLSFAGDTWGPQFGEEAIGFLRKMKADHEAKQKGGRGSLSFGDIARVTGMDTAGRPLGFGSTIYSPADTTQRDEFGRPIDFDLVGIANRQEQELRDEQQRMLQARQAKNDSKLSSMFGPLEDFNAYASAFSALTGSVTAAMDAWITGSMSAGQAIKKFLSEHIKAIASQMAVEALKHGAYAIGYAALGDPRAGMHAVAAAKFAAGATVATIAAKALHSGGGGPNVPASGGASAGGGGGMQGGSTSTGTSSGQRDSRPIYVLLGENFGDSSLRQRRQQAESAVERALRERDE